MRLLTLFLFLFFTGHSMAQQDPLFASEGQRSFWFNPASIGTLNAYSVNTVGRRQWVGLDGAPTSLQVNAAYKGLRFKSNGATFAKSALGVNYLFDQIGYMRAHTVTVPFNFQIKLANTFLSIGVSPGLQNRVIYGGVWIPPSPGPDPVISPIGVTDTEFLMGAGIHWYNHRFSLGFAANHLFEERFEKIAYNTVRTYYANASYSYPVLRGLTLRGVATWRYAGGFQSITGMVYGIMGATNELSVGLGYRGRDSVIGAVTKRFGKFYGGYFIEYLTSPLAPGYFTHEIRMAFELFDSSIYPSFDPTGNPNF